MVDWGCSMEDAGKWPTTHLLYKILTLSQSQLPKGATLLGTPISSNKNEYLSNDQKPGHPSPSYQPCWDFLIKVSHCAFMLLAILPVPKFLQKNRKICGVLENHLIHECIDFVVEHLKIATEIGIMMLDPLSWCWYCFTPLISAIIDTQSSDVCRY